MEQEKKEKTVDEGETFPWYYKSWAVALAIVCFGPLGLLLLWVRPRTRLSIKILVSIVVFVLTGWMMVETAKYYEAMQLHFEEVAEAVKNV